MPELPDSIAIRYLTETKLDRNTVTSRLRPAIGEADAYKFYPRAEKIALPRTWKLNGYDFTELLQRRRSRRRFADQPIGLDDLAFLLWASQGITGRAGNYLFRTAPSGGALYPVETYLCCERVQGVEPGLFHFDVPNFRLERLGSGSLAHRVAGACLGQSFMGKGAVIFIWSAVFRRNMSKYGHRGLRYILLDAGHICQNLLLAAGAVDCGGCPVAAFYDDELNSLLGLNPDEESTLYTAVIGRLK